MCAVCCTRLAVSRKCVLCALRAAAGIEGAYARRARRYELSHVVRTHMGAQDASYSCVYQREDPDGQARAADNPAPSSADACSSACCMHAVSAERLVHHRNTAQTVKERVEITLPYPSMTHECASADAGGRAPEQGPDGDRGVLAKGQHHDAGAAGAAGLGAARVPGQPVRAEGAPAAPYASQQACHYCNAHRHAASQPRAALTRLGLCRDERQRCAQDAAQADSRAALAASRLLTRRLPFGSRSRGSAAAQVLRVRCKAYLPDFSLAFEHFCIHTGGRGVLDELEKQLKLSPEHMAPSRAALWRCACCRERHRAGKGVLAGPSSGGMLWKPCYAPRGTGTACVAAGRVEAAA